jgi:triacylglycerol lipase
MSHDMRYSASKDDLLNPGRRDEFFPPPPLDRPESDAVLSAEMARLAYCRMEPDFGFDQKRIQEVLGRIGFTGRFFESHGTKRGAGIHCFLAQREKDKLSVVAFRGTDAADITDVWYDVDLELEPWRTRGRVHSGFAHALDKVLPALDPVLGSIAARRLLYTGHSLGAALATLLASVRRPDALYTFGCPRVGDREFVDSLQGVTSYRYQDCCDAVARVPPEALDFCHLGEPFYINGDRKITFEPSSAAIRSDRIRAAFLYAAKYAWRFGNLGCRSLADHAPVNYIWPVRADQSQAGKASADSKAPNYEGCEGISA